MNGLGLPGPQPTVKQLREQLAMAEACEPIEQELLESKQAYREALEGGDQEAIAAAKKRKQAASHHINETRTWLRAESQIAQLTAGIAKAEADLAAPHWQAKASWSAEDRKHLEESKAHLAAMKASLASMEWLVAPYREALGSLPAPVVDVVVEDGSVSVSTPAVNVRAKAGK